MKIAVSMPDEMYNDLKTAAKALGRPMAELIREAIREALATPLLPVE